jgi:CubicO group peptidase (beta-lactamase class C family)
MPSNHLSVDADPTDLGFDPARLTRIAGRLDQYLATNLFAGYSVAVGRAGKVAYVHHSGMRDKENALPMNNDTVFRIYSMTKPITAVAAMMLWEEGKFELTDPISNLSLHLQMYVYIQKVPQMVRSRFPLPNQ